MKKDSSNTPDITPEWDNIYDGFMYVSIDKCGSEYAYARRPFICDTQWRTDGHLNSTGRKFDMSNIDWRETLSQRPKK